jgi:RNA-splicing ligase RtcB
MKIINGSQNYAKIMVNEIDEETEKQIKNFLSCPVFKDSKIRIMADTHAGKGSVIGFTATLGDYIIPNVVGVDISCGVEFYKIGQLNVVFSKFDQFIRDNIPSGFNIHSKTVDYLLSDEMLKFRNNLNNICKKIDMPYEKAINSIGTLGGGNHMLELDIDPEGNVWLLIHSGSRNFGLRLANYHQNKAKDLMRHL